MEQKKELLIQCPFYQGRDGRANRIRCEGILEGSSLLLDYPDRQDYAIQLATFCCRHYKRCEVARMLMTMKYDQ